MINAFSFRSFTFLSLMVSFPSESCSNKIPPPQSKMRFREEESLERISNSNSRKGCQFPPCVFTKSGMETPPVRYTAIMSVDTTGFPVILDSLREILDLPTPLGPMRAIFFKPRSALRYAWSSPVKEYSTFAGLRP